jgi:DNA-binding LytR/AlgR family response regulator
MNAPTILIAEDEELIRAEVARLTQHHWPQARVVATVEDGDSALAAWEQYAPDVAFLDIQMPGCTGLEVARSIFAAQSKTQVVFLTAYNEHAIAAFDAGAFDYLLKPVKDARFAQTVRRLNEAMRQPQATIAGLENLLDRLTQAFGQPLPKASLKWISASSGNQIKLIDLEDVYFLQSDNKYTRVVYRDGEALIRKPLRELIAELDGDRFKQVHRASVVNLNAVASIHRDGLGKGQIRFKQSKEVVDVSAVYMGLFKAL